MKDTTNNTLIDIHLVRRKSSGQGTDGFLSIPELQFACFTLELPWKNNQRDISCIPPGVYDLAWHESARHKAFMLKDVPGRSYILVHPGNFAGDTAAGFRSDVQGCILPGMHLGRLRKNSHSEFKQKAVLNSRAAVVKFNELLQKAADKGKKPRMIISWHSTNIGLINYG